jgi:hypothetical protein
MTAYFKPLRRKIGVMTLGMACLFSVGWVRSAYISDSLILPNVAHGRDTTNILSSVKNRLIWQRLSSANKRIVWERWYTLENRDSPNSQSTFSYPIWTTTPASPESVSSDVQWNAEKPHWRLWWCGIEYTESLPIDNDHGRNLLISYWSIVIPLTLLSAWLLPSKLRQKQTEPAPAEDRPQ